MIGSKIRSGLAIETSIRGVSLGIFEVTEDGVSLSAAEHCEDRQASSSFLPAALKQLLSDTQLELPSLDSLVVSRGPGSFTGIKIGLSFAQGLIRGGYQGQVMGVSALECLAKSMQLVNSGLLLPATRTQGYAALLDPQGLTHLLVAKIDEGRLILQDEEGQDPTWVPDEASFIPVLPWEQLTQIEHPVPGLKEPMKFDESRNLVLTSMAVEALNCKSPSIEEQTLSPLYMRRSAPEERYIGKKS